MLLWPCSHLVDHCAGLGVDDDVLLGAPQVARVGGGVVRGVGLRREGHALGLGRARVLVLLLGQGELDLDVGEAAAQLPHHHPHRHLLLQRLALGPVDGAGCRGGGGVHRALAVVHSDRAARLLRGGA